MFSPYSFQGGGTLTMEAPTPSMNGQSRIPEYVGAAVNSPFATGFGAVGVAPGQPITGINPYAVASCFPTTVPFGGAAVQPTVGYAMPGTTVNPFVNPMIGAYNSAAFLNPMTTINPLAINPYASVNPFFGINPFSAINTVNPFVNTFNPYVAHPAFASPWGVNPMHPFNSVVAHPFYGVTPTTPFGIAPQIGACQPFTAINPFSAINPVAMCNPHTAAAWSPWAGGLGHPFFRAGAFGATNVGIPNVLAACQPGIGTIGSWLNPVAAAHPGGSTINPITGLNPIASILGATFNPATTLGLSNPYINPFCTVNDIACNAFGYNPLACNPTLSTYGWMNPAIAGAFNPALGGTTRWNNPFTSWNTGIPTLPSICGPAGCCL